MTVLLRTPYTRGLSKRTGQVAQLVERGPEKAGVGGSNPSLATSILNNLASAKKRVGISRAYNRVHRLLHFTFGGARSNHFQLPRRAAD